MGVDEADTLQSILEKANSWPVWSADRAGGITTGTYAQAGMYGQSLRDIALWVALRENDRKAIRFLTNWPPDRELRIDPLPSRVGEAYSDLLYGQNPEFLAPAESDQEMLEEMTDSNFLADQLTRWCDQAITEGEIWWRIYTDLEMSEWPIIDAHSRLDVVPLFFGRKIPAVAFISPILTQEIKFEKQVIIQIWRHVEIQTEGYVRNLLYRGTVGNLGHREALGTDPFGETEGIEDEWEHGLPVMLAGRVPNKLGRDWRLGVSQLQGVKDLVLDLNESRSIMAENARNTAKARMVVPAEYLDEQGRFDAGQDILVAESADESLDEAKKGPVTVLEYTFQAAQLLAHIEDLVVTILTRCGLAEQFVQSRGESGGNQAFSGTALRTRLIPTTLAAASKGKFWDRAVPDMLRGMAMVANLPIERGGCGKNFKEPEGKFVQKRGDVLPEDLNEESQRHVMAVQGEVESIFNAVREMHPEWEEDEINEEVKRIKEDHAGPKIVHDPNEPPGGQTTADAVPVPGEDKADLRAAMGTRQPGSSRVPDGQMPGKRPPRVNAGAEK